MKRNPFYADRIRKQFPIGAEFGRLTVRGYRHYTMGQGGYAVVCTCACGGRKTVKYPNQMKRHLVESCGCLQQENRAKIVLRPRGHLPPGIAAQRTCYRNYKYGAVNRGITFEITIEEFLLIASQPCHYCGAPPVAHPIPPSIWWKHTPFIGNSIDRIDNTRGYVAGNAASCCKICNHAKNNLTSEKFMTWIDRVYNHQHKGG